MLGKGTELLVIVAFNIALAEIHRALNPAIISERRQLV